MLQGGYYMFRMGTITYSECKSFKFCFIFVFFLFGFIKFPKKKVNSRIQFLNYI